MESLITFLLCITFFGILGMVLTCIPFKKIYNSFLKLKQRKNTYAFPNIKTQRHEPNLRNTDLFHLNLHTKSNFRFSPTKNLSNAADEFSVLYLLAPAQAPYKGTIIWRTLIEHGLVYGKMRIFHAYNSNTDFNQKILFSIAGATEPGYFEQENIAETYLSGLCFFMHHHAHHPLKNFKKMLQTAQQVQEILGGTLCDHQQQPLSQGMIDQYQQKLILHD